MSIPGDSEEGLGEGAHDDTRNTLIWRKQRSEPEKVQGQAVCLCTLVLCHETVVPSSACTAMWSHRTRKDIVGHVSSQTKFWPNGHATRLLYQSVNFNVIAHTSSVWILVSR